MKKTAIVIGLALYSSLSLADCLENICTGEYVIDNGNSIGLVTAIKGTNIVYRIGSYDYETKPSLLVKRINSLETPDNSYIVDSGNSVGTVQMSFADGRVQFRVGSYNYVTKNYSPETGDYDGIKTGTTVVDSGNSVGVALHAFKNGKIQYKVGSYAYVNSGLSPETVDYNGLKKGMKCIDSGDSVGTALTVFKNGKIQYKVGSYAYVATGLSPEVSNIGGLKAGVQVLDSGNSFGKVLTVFENGKTQYQVGSYAYVSKALSPEVSAYGDFASDAVVIDAGESVGTALQAFEDGRIRYQVGSYAYVAKSSTMSTKVESLGALSAGLTVVDSGDSVGSIIHLFKNNKAQYQVNGYKYITDASKLSEEVAEHEKYQKDVIYAAERFVGKPIRFFKNGKVQLKSIFSNSTAVGSKLASEVTTLGEAKAGSLILTSYRNKGEVKQLFENGTIVASFKVQDEGGQEKFEEKSLTLHFDLSKVTEKNADDFLIEISRSFDFQEITWSFASYSVLTEDAEEFKLMLRSRMEKADLGFEKNIKKKVLEYLGGKISDPVTPLPPKPTPSEPLPGDPEVIHVRIGNHSYDALVAKTLTEMGKKFTITDTKGKKNLSVHIERNKKFLSSSCQIALQYSMPNVSIGLAKKKNFIGKGEKACNKNLVKMIKEIGL